MSAGEREILRTVRRTLMVSFAGRGADRTPRRVPGWIRERVADGLGSLVFFADNGTDEDSFADLTSEVHALAPSIITAVDEEGGDVTRLHHRAGSPHAGAGALGRLDEPSTTAAVAGHIAADLRARGIDLALAPVADVNVDPRNPVIGSRSFGNDPAKASRHVAAWVEGLQARGVGACLKHFPGHGDTAVDSHTGSPHVGVDVATLAQRELPPFSAGVRAGAVAVMTAHIVVPAIDDTDPVTFSPAALALLRDAPVSGGLGFGGLAISDALDMVGARAAGNIPQAAVRALAAGVDLLCVGAALSEEQVDQTERALVAAVRSGSLPRARLDQAAARVDAASERLRLLRERAEGMPQSESWAPGVSERAAEAAITVRGTIPDLRDALVVQLVGQADGAVGRSWWGLPPDGRVLAGREPLRVGEGDLLPEVHAGRAVVVLVRKSVRLAWTRELIIALTRGGNPVVVVEFGHPDPDLPFTQASVCTWGASRAVAAPLDRLLASGGRERAA